MGLGPRDASYLKRGNHHENRAIPLQRTLGSALIKILIVNDQAVARDRVKRIFDKQLGEATFGEAGTAQEAFKLVREEGWDAVVLDISLDVRNGLEVLKEFKQNCPVLPVLILSMHPEKQYAHRAFKAGAAGYITKDSPLRELVEIINTVSLYGCQQKPAR